MKKVSGSGFNEEEYVRRLRLLRTVHSGENQQDFAKRLGIPFKRWSNYERGYPIPRETAWLLLEEIKGLTVEWLWFGWDDYLSPDLRKRLKKAEESDQILLAAQEEREAAERKYRKTVEGITKNKASLSSGAKKSRAIPAE